MAFSYSSTQNVANYGNNPQSVTVTFAMQQSLTATMTYTKAFAFSQKASFKLGIPFIGNTTLEFGATQTFTTTTTNTDTQTSTYTTALQQQIPGMTLQQVNATIRASLIITSVPVNIKTYYTCGRVDSEDNVALIQTDGTIAGSSSQLNIVYGPQYPLEAPVVYPEATATCASNPTCADLGFRTGNCCPTANGVYRPCCSFCAAKPACADYAFEPTTMCCPTRTNRWLDCCGKRPASVGDAAP